MHSLRRAATRDVVLGVIAVVCFGAAVFYFLTNRSSEEAAPTDAASVATFVCAGCGEFFSLNGAEMDAAFRSKDMDRSRGRTLGFKCKKCGEVKGVRAAKCPAHGDVVKMEPGPKDAQKCSKCDWIPG